MFTIDADVYYSIPERRMVSVYQNPEHFITFTNEKGEMKVYYPKKNQVYQDQSEFYSASTDVFYFFFTQGAAYDLGLSAMGFVLEETKMEDNLTVTLWNAPTKFKSQITSAKLVLEDFIPIYLAYYDQKNNLKSKTYYSNYQNLGSVVVPTRITEIAYISPTDSIVSRKDYTNIIHGKDVSRDYLDLKIPSNAKIIKQ